MTTHPSILAWRIPWWAEEPGGLQSMGSQLDTTERLTLLLFTFTLGGVGCRGCAVPGFVLPILCFCSMIFKSAVRVFALFVSFVQNLHQQCLPAVIFSPIQFPYILLLKEKCVQRQALEQRVPGSNLSQRGGGSQKRGSPQHKRGSHPRQRAQGWGCIQEIQRVDRSQGLVQIQGEAG